VLASHMSCERGCCGCWDDDGAGTVNSDAGGGGRTSAPAKAVAAAAAAADALNTAAAGDVASVNGLREQ